MKWQIITPSNVPVEVEAENDAYVQGLPARGYVVKPKVTIHRRPLEECEACSS